MPESPLRPISGQEKRHRLRRIQLLAKRLGFKGKIEYYHVLSKTGGAQYCQGPSEDQDRLLVFGEAFERDADPQDFSLEAILAHERGHQLLVRQPKLSPILARGISLVSEEILASLIGSLIAEKEQDREVLYYKALYQAVARGMDSLQATRLLHDLRLLLEKTL